MNFHENVQTSSLTYGAKSLVQNRVSATIFIRSFSCPYLFKKLRNCSSQSSINYVLKRVHVSGYVGSDANSRPEIASLSSTLKNIICTVCRTRAVSAECFPGLFQ